MSVESRQGSSRFQLGLMWSRVKNVSRLDRETVLELREDKSATGQSIAVLVLATLSLGLGNSLLTEFRGNDISPYGIIVGTLTSLLTGSFAGFVWSATLFLVGTKLFQGKTGYWQLARPFFFSISPSFLFILIAIPLPILDSAIALVAAAWVILLQGFVLKQVMGFDIRRTVLTLAVGFLILLFIYLVLR